MSGPLLKDGGLIWQKLPNRFQLNNVNRKTPAEDSHWKRVAYYDCPYLVFQLGFPTWFSKTTGSCKTHCKNRVVAPSAYLIRATIAQRSLAILSGSRKDACELFNKFR